MAPLLIAKAVASPWILSQSASQDVRTGAAFTAFISAGDGSLEYQWSKDGVAIPGENDPTFVIPAVSAGDAGVYRATVVGPTGSAISEPIGLSVVPPPSLGVFPGIRGVVQVPERLAYYDIYLPSNYGQFQNSYPVLFTFSPDGGGLVSHFRQVAEEKKWIVIGVSQSRNGLDVRMKYFFVHEVLKHALDNFRIDPNRIFVSGMSGGGWFAFDAAKQASPLVAGVFSMGGWLGNQHSQSRDMYLPGLQVARANGDNDKGANYYLGPDRFYLQNFLQPDDIRDWSFPGGHVMSPEAIQREVFDWLLSRTTASTAGQREAARLEESMWKARVTAGEAPAVYREVVEAAFSGPRTARALAAMRVMDFIFERPLLFLRERPHDFGAYTRSNYVLPNLYMNLYAYMQHRDPARQISAAAAAQVFVHQLFAVLRERWTEVGTIFLHPERTALESYILENSLYARTEHPFTGDWDGDGRNNFSEFTLGSDPLVPDASPSAEIRWSAVEVQVALPRSRSGPFMNILADKSRGFDGRWTPFEPEPLGFQQLEGGRSRLTFAAGPPGVGSMGFFRLRAAVSPNVPLDGNGDGIPYHYQFPSDTRLYDAWVAPDFGLPDARSITEFPGGTPLYLRYLTAAEIGVTVDIQKSYRYHPALTRYRGSLTHETWLNVPGSTLVSAAVVMADRVPNDLRLITTTQAPWYRANRQHLPGENSLERTRGFIIPEVTGDYQFSISGDDQGELWLSPTVEPGGKSLIARVSSATSFQSFTVRAEQTSPVIHLEGGVRYYIEILHKQGSGTAHCSVAWITPNSGGQRVLIPAECLAPLPDFGGSEPF